jgi:hypothetical protein
MSRSVDLVITGCTALLHDEQEDVMFEEMRARMPALLDRSHGKRIQDYDT